MTAELVRCGKRTADIGTDHAYLPAYLIINGIIPSAIAADLRKGPLENAKETVKKYSLEEKIELRLSDGFDNLYYTEADDFVLAGMGGTLMTKLMERTEWLLNPDLHLVLQPQSHSNDVRVFLTQNGFEILNEKAVFEGKRIYTCLDAVFTGNAEKMPESFEYFGKLTENTDEASIEYIKRQTEKLKRERAALESSGNDYSYIDRILRGVER